MKTMKMKTASILILSLLMILALPFTAFASGDSSELHGSGPWTSNNGTEFYMPYVEDTSARVYDYADLLTEEGEEALTSRILELQAKKGCDIFILTSYDVPMDINYETTTSMQYVEQFYMDNGFAEDCLAMIIDMNNRVIYTMGHGMYGTDKYVSFHKEVYDHALEYASSGDYYGAMEKFLDDIYRLGNIGAAAVPTFLSLIISLVLSIITILFLVGKHSMTQPDSASKVAIKPVSFTKTRSLSSFKNKTVTKRRIERSSSSGGSGFSGGSHSGGGFSGGGGSFSGGGGHF